MQSSEAAIALQAQFAVVLHNLLLFPQKPHGLSTTELARGIRVRQLTRCFQLRWSATSRAFRNI